MSTQSGGNQPQNVQNIGGRPQNPMPWIILFLVGLTSFLSGMVYGFGNSAASTQLNELAIALHIPVGGWQEGVLGGITPWGGALGAGLTLLFLMRFDKKHLLMAAGVGFLAVGAVTLISPELWYVVSALRLSDGMVIGLLATITGAYVLETVGSEHRVINVQFQTGIVIAIALVTFVAGNYIHAPWRPLLAWSGVAGLFLLAVAKAAPNAPITAGESVTLAEVWRNLEWRWQLILACLILFVQQECLVNGIFSFLGPLLGPGNALLATIVNVAGTFIGIFVIAKLGERRSFVLGVLLATPMLLGVAAVTLTGHKSLAEWPLFGFVLVFAALIGPSSWPLASSAFRENKVRNVCVPIATVVNWLTNAVVSLLFGLAVADTTRSIMFLVSGIGTLGVGIYITRVIKRLSQLEGGVQEPSEAFDQSLAFELPATAEIDPTSETPIPTPAWVADLGKEPDWAANLRKMIEEVQQAQAQQPAQQAQIEEAVAHVLAQRDVSAPPLTRAILEQVIGEQLDQRKVVDAETFAQVVQGLSLQMQRVEEHLQPSTTTTQPQQELEAEVDIRQLVQPFVIALQESEPFRALQRELRLALLLQRSEHEGGDVSTITTVSVTHAQKALKVLEDLESQMAETLRNLRMQTDQVQAIANQSPTSQVIQDAVDIVAHMLQSLSSASEQVVALRRLQGPPTDASAAEVKSFADATDFFMQCLRSLRSLIETQRQLESITPSQTQITTGMTLQETKKALEARVQRERAQETLSRSWQGLWEQAPMLMSQCVVELQQVLQ